jgi:hypothetical protein
MEGMVMKAVLSVAVLGLIGFAALPAFSDNNAAVHVDDFSCNLFDGNGNLVLAEGSSQVTNNGGVTVLKCSATGLANDTGRAQRFNFDSTGVLCGFNGGGTTEDWLSTVSASGNGTLTCRVNN